MMCQMTSAKADVADNVSYLAHELRGTHEQQRRHVRHVNSVQGILVARGSA